MEHKVVSEYKKLLENKRKLETELQFLEQGHISKKTMKGKTYYYLQNRMGGKQKSRRIKKEEVDSVTDEIARRGQYEDELRRLKARLSKLEQEARATGKNMNRQLMLLKLSTGMDHLTVEQKEKSASFASAMNAVEGIPVSEQMAQEIIEWQEGRKSFSTIFETTLKRYGFSVEV